MLAIKGAPTCWCQIIDKLVVSAIESSELLWWPYEIRLAVRSVVFMEQIGQALAGALLAAMVVPAECEEERTR
jgi:hypothetical protein